LYETCSSTVLRTIILVVSSHRGRPNNERN